MRHWKQHWDPKADLVARRRLRMGDNPKKPFVMPGEVISQAQREKLGLNRLRRWFENGTLELAEFKAPEPQRRLALQQREIFDPTQEGVLIPDPGKADAPVAVLDAVEKVIKPVVEEEARLERNRKAREKRAADKKAEAKRLERNRKAREKRAEKRVNSGA